MARAAKRPANKPLTGLFAGPPTTQFYLLHLTGLLTIFEIPLSLRANENEGYYCLNLLLIFASYAPDLVYDH